MRHLTIIPAVLALFPAAAHAGPWAREPGDVFLSYTVSGEAPRDAIATGTAEIDPFHSLYLEIGLGSGLTAVLDAGRDGGSEQAVALLRYSFSLPDAQLQLSAEIGAGMRETIYNEPRRDILRLGGAAGVGFGAEDLAWLPFEHAGGWATLEAHALLDRATDWHVWQAEGTLGVNLDGRHTGMLQIKAEAWPGSEMAVTLSPGLLRRFEGGTTILLGGRIGVSGSDTLGLRLGLWREF